MPRARILLVEDDEALRDVVERNLLARGHDVSIAADARSALEQLHTAPFDLIVLDINLPDQTGWEVLRAAQRCSARGMPSTRGGRPQTAGGGPLSGTGERGPVGRI